MTDGNSVTHILLPSAKKQSENPLTGEWEYSYTMWYSSELTLQDNGTFKFHDQGCYGQKFSQGEWSYNNGIVQLTSFDTFKQTKQTEANKSNEVTNQKNASPKLKKGQVKYTIAESTELLTPAWPGPNDTIRIYLDKVQLQLRNDTLYCVGSDKLPEGAKFHRTKNNR